LLRRRYAPSSLTAPSVGTPDTLKVMPRNACSLQSRKVPSGYADQSESKVLASAFVRDRVEQTGGKSNRIRRRGGRVGPEARKHLRLHGPREGVVHALVHRRRLPAVLPAHKCWANDEASTKASTNRATTAAFYSCFETPNEKGQNQCICTRSNKRPLTTPLHATNRELHRTTALFSDVETTVLKMAAFDLQARYRPDLNSRCPR